MLNKYELSSFYYLWHSDPTHKQHSERSYFANMIRLILIGVLTVINSTWEQQFTNIFNIVRKIQNMKIVQNAFR